MEKKDQNKLQNVNWDFFKIDSFAKSIDLNRIIICGNTNEGKSFFAAQLLFNKLIHNIENNIKTSLEVASETNNAKDMIEKIGLVLIKLYPFLENDWNSDECLVQFSHTKHIETMFAKLSEYKMIDENNDPDKRLSIQKIWFLDDINTVFKDRKGDNIKFFDRLVSNGRHYNIICLFCSQGFEYQKEIMRQIDQVIFVGEIPCDVWEIYKKRTKFRFDKSKDDAFYNEYSSRIGISKSRNILIIDKIKGVSFHKVPKSFINLWEPLVVKPKK